MQFDVGCYCCLGGGSLGILGLAAGIYSKFTDSIKIIKEIMRLDAEKNDFNENKKIITEFNESLMKNYIKKDLKKLS